MPLISVILPTYNVEKYICEAIDSILNQSFSDFELIIVDDCSTDNTYSLCLEYASVDKRVKVFRNEENSKIEFSLNKALSLAKGYYVVRMDGDDISEPKRLEIMKGYLEDHPDIVLVGTSTITINAEGQEIGRTVFFDDLEVYNGTKTLLPSSSQVTKSGASFQGWYTNSSFTGGVVTKTNAKQRGNITYYAKWSGSETTPPVTTPPITPPTVTSQPIGEDEYSVTLVTNGGTLAPGAGIYSYKPGTEKYLPDSYQISRHGYTFAGWYENFWLSGIRKYKIASTDTGNKVFYAKWIPNVYNVVLNTNGGSITANNVTSYTVGTGATLPTATDFIRTGLLKNICRHSQRNRRVQAGR